MLCILKKNPENKTDEEITVEGGIRFLDWKPEFVKFDTNWYRCIKTYGAQECVWFDQILRYEK